MFLLLTPKSRDRCADDASFANGRPPTASPPEPTSYVDDSYVGWYTPAHCEKSHRLDLLPWRMILWVTLLSASTVPVS